MILYSLPCCFGISLHYLFVYLFIYLVFTFLFTVFYSKMTDEECETFNSEPCETTENIEELWVYVKRLYFLHIIHSNVYTFYFSYN